MLAGFAEKPDNLIELQARQHDLIHRHNFIARLQPRLRGRRSRHGLQNDHAPGQHGDDGAESLALGILHLLELLVLIGIEEDGMRIQGAQHARNRALIDRLLRVHRIGGFGLDNGKQVP